MKIDVLGTEYTVTYKRPHEDTLLETALGYCDPTSKTIIILDHKPEDRRTQTYDRPDIAMSNALRHELVHAFLYESGLEAYYEDEVLVNWISLQFDKLREAFSIPVTVAPGTVAILSNNIRCCATNDGLPDKVGAETMDLDLDDPSECNDEPSAFESLQQAIVTAIQQVLDLVETAIKKLDRLIDYSNKPKNSPVSVKPECKYDNPIFAPAHASFSEAMINAREQAQQFEAEMAKIRKLSEESGMSFTDAASSHIAAKLDTENADPEVYSPQLVFCGWSPAFAGDNPPEELLHAVNIQLNSADKLSDAVKAYTHSFTQEGFGALTNAQEVYECNRLRMEDNNGFSCT